MTAAERAELKRLRHVERCASAYRFAGAAWTLAFLKERGWRKEAEGWWPPKDCPCRVEPASEFVALAIELELALECHQ